MPILLKSGCFESREEVDCIRMRRESPVMSEVHIISAD